MTFSVIGAGPIGSIAAKLCAREHETFIYESQKNDSRRVQCSGLLSRSGLGRIGVDPAAASSKRFVRNSVRGARIYSPSGILLEIDGGKDKAYVVDRREFDKRLLEEAVDTGAVHVEKNVGSRELADIRKRSDKLILATGTNYNLHKTLGLNVPKRFLYGAQYEMRLECDNDYVEMYLNVPGFFSWIIPAGDSCRIGLCAGTNPVPYLDSFVARLEKDGRVLDKKILDKNYGIIPVYDPRLRTQYPGISLVGDAAGHVKATTGGGIILGGVAAGYVLEEHYEKKWRHAVGGELRRHLIIRRLIDRLSDKSLDKLMSLLKENKEIIEKRGDMDTTADLLVGLAASPRFLGKLMLQAPAYLRDFLDK